MPDLLFEDPRLAGLYDGLHPDRSDLAVYLAIVEELDARSVLDVGCGTGTFACLAAERGLEAIGVDPAAASLDVARAKPGAHRVCWVHGDATGLPPLEVDVAIMTGNVAQVFLTDEAWTATLAGVRGALRPDGHLVFETRNLADEAWRGWNRRDSESSTEIPGIGRVTSWVDVTMVEEDRVSFRWTYTLADGAVLTSDSTLRFRSRGEVERSLLHAGFFVVDVRDAPDRPGRELVFVARRAR